MSTNYKYGVGLRNVGSYQVSGHPYTTGSTDMGSANTELKVEFPYVTKDVTVIASGSSIIKVHFNSNSDGRVLAGGHFITRTLMKIASRLTLNVKKFI